MKRFADLYSALDSTNKTNAKVELVAEYLRHAPPADAAWAVYFLRGGKLRSPFSSRLLRTWAAETAGLPEWLADECYQSVGDSAETAALLLPPTAEATDDNATLAHWIEERLMPLQGQSPARQRESMQQYWRALPETQRLTFHKLLTGTFRSGVSEGLVTKAIAAVTGIDANIITHRLAGAWQPSAEGWQWLTQAETTGTPSSQPYPFCLAHPLDTTPDTLGQPHDWIIEHKWDGIRAQVIKRKGVVHIWSRGGELIDPSFPELTAEASLLPDGTVIDGEILAWRDTPLPFARLQHRIARKKPGAKILQETPARLLAFDLLEWQGADIRHKPLNERRRLLESLPIFCSQQLKPRDWNHAAELRTEARKLLAEGLMLKRADSPYGTGRERGVWWKWKLEPYSVDAVLIYAQRGTGRRAALYTDYTFGVWDGAQLVPFAKAYSGLTDKEIKAVDSFIRRNTLERFGPVSTVKPELVFEIAFEGIQESGRHKSGVAVRFPRMARWRQDKAAADADTIQSVRALLETSPR